MRVWKERDAMWRGRRPGAEHEADVYVKRHLGGSIYDVCTKGDGGYKNAPSLRINSI